MFHVEGLLDQVFGDNFDAATIPTRRVANVPAGSPVFLTAAPAARRGDDSAWRRRGQRRVSAAVKPDERGRNFHFSGIIRCPGAGWGIRPAMRENNWKLFT